MSYLRFESNVNYDLGKTGKPLLEHVSLFESNVNYDLGKTRLLHKTPSTQFESNVNYNFKGPLQAKNCEFQQHKETICQEQMLLNA